MKTIAQSIAMRKGLTFGEREYARRWGPSCEKIALRHFLELKEPIQLDELSTRIQVVAQGTVQYRSLFRETVVLMAKRGIIQRKIRPGLDYMGIEDWNYVYYMDDLQKLAAL